MTHIPPHKKKKHPDPLYKDYALFYLDYIHLVVLLSAPVSNQLPPSNDLSDCEEANDLGGQHAPGDNLGTGDTLKTLEEVAGGHVHGGGLRRHVRDGRSGGGAKAFEGVDYRGKCGAEGLELAEWWVSGHVGLLIGCDNRGNIRGKGQ
jgi:hypothetical protein